MQDYSSFVGGFHRFCFIWFFNHHFSEFLCCFFQLQESLQEVTQPSYPTTPALFFTGVVFEEGPVMCRGRPQEVPWLMQTYMLIRVLVAKEFVCVETTRMFPWRLDVDFAFVVVIQMTGTLNKLLILIVSLIDMA
jgi:hypothetical protein